MADEKIYYPETIEDSPLPNAEASESYGTSQSTANDTYSPQTIKSQVVPKKRVAQELIGSALNTKSRKILATFELAQSGGIQIGEYENGISGDIRITPTGIVARDTAGVTTFALDAETGDAVFKGVVQAGSIISAGDIVGGTLFLADGGVNIVAESGIITFNPGVDVKLVGDVSPNTARIVFENKNDPTRHVDMFLWDGSGAEDEIHIEPYAYTGIGADSIVLKIGELIGFDSIQMWANDIFEIIGNVDIDGNLAITGALSKGSGTFDIAHPDPSKPEGTRLRHSFVESPTAGDNIYRFKVDVIHKEASINLPDYFSHLNENPQVWISPVTCLGAAKAFVTGNKVHITVSEDGIYNVLVIGTRKDPFAIQSWNEKGVEYVRS